MVNLEIPYLVFCSPPPWPPRVKHSSFTEYVKIQSIQDYILDRVRLVSFFFQCY